ncbi:hypothetical protein BH11BAC1_BH11BAC1_12650 [soil metagenome]
METEDELKAENNLLKLKLELEHGMQMMDTSALDPEVENQWLSDIYKFEKQFKEAGKIKVYDKIGQPDFKPWNELSKEVLTVELDRLSEILQEHQIVLECICEYEDAIIYRFITEELFQYEVDDIFVEGMVQHFIYEEFHPNHEYDLKRQATSFIEKLLTQEWNPEWDGAEFAAPVLFRGKEFDKHSISTIILAYQETFHPIKITELSIKHVSFDLEKKFGAVRLQLSYDSQAEKGKTLTYTGKSFISFKRMEWDYWCISNFQLPGFGD